MFGGVEGMDGIYTKLVCVGASNYFLYLNFFQQLIDSNECYELLLLGS